jgi:hypothetical protein
MYESNMISQVFTYKATWCHNPGDHNPNSNQHETPKRINLMTTAIQYKFHKQESHKFCF